MLKKCIFYSLLINLLIQCSDKHSNSLRHITNDIISRQHLAMISRGYQDTYLQEPSLAARYQAAFNEINNQIRPLIESLPQIESQLEFVRQNHSLEILSQLLSKALRDYESIRVNTSRLCDLGKTLHEEWQSISNFNNSSHK